ncbi:MAG: amidohydrolase family protein [Rhodomicrobiaceae bacterium]
MDRRSFLQTLIVLGLTNQGIFSAGAQTAQGRAQRRFIDAHCHFFNAKDLPVRGFIQEVVLGDYAELRPLPATGQLPMAESVWKGLASLLIKQILGAGTPDPREEMQCLAEPAACDDFARFARLPQIPRSATFARDGETPEARLLRLTLEEHYAAAESLNTRSATAVAQDEDIDAFVGFVLGEMKDKGRIAPEASPQRLRSERAARSLFLVDIADFLTGGDSVFSRYFRWANLLTAYRSQIIARYIALYQTAQRHLVLAAPALVDFSYWLGDQTQGDLQEQTKLMGLLSLRQASPVHGYAPFDPARNILHEPGKPSSLAIVQEAVAQHGFIGVKLYPPMGFRPSGNADERDYPPSVSQNDPGFGRKLDEQLFELYDWCAREDVAILAHTTDSQSANVDFGKRADPKFWLAVLEKHNGLRINLAHFGNFSQAKSGGTYDLSLYPQTWEARIAELIGDRRFTHLYADVSYFGWVLGTDSANTANVTAVKKMCAEFLKADPAAERLLFGTDWSFIAREDKFEAYLDGIEAFFRDLGLNDAAINNLFYRNAMRFFGLRSGEKTFSRLEAFYARNGKPMPSFA